MANVLNNYDSMSVHDLLCEALECQEREQLMGEREPFTDATLIEIESAIRKAVIREASVGVVSIYMTPDCARHIKLPNGIKPGSYVVIPKETP